MLSAGMSFLESLGKRVKWYKLGGGERGEQVLLKILGEKLKGIGAELTRGEERKRKEALIHKK